jgi:hypothetical protein
VLSSNKEGLRCTPFTQVVGLVARLMSSVHSDRRWAVRMTQWHDDGK